MKVHINLTVDLEVIKKAKELRINISEVLEDALRIRLAIMEENIDGINEQTTRLELENEQKKLDKSSQKVQKLSNLLIKFEENRVKNQKTLLLKEKKTIENQKKCVKCGIIISNDAEIKEIDGQKHCKSCFLAY